MKTGWQIYFDLEDLEKVMMGFCTFRRQCVRGRKFGGGGAR